MKVTATCNEVQEGHNLSLFKYTQQMNTHTVAESHQVR